MSITTRVLPELQNGNHYWEIRVGDLVARITADPLMQGVLRRSPELSLTHESVSGVQVGLREGGKGHILFGALIDGELDTILLPALVVLTVAGVQVDRLEYTASRNGGLPLTTLTAFFQGDCFEVGATHKTVAMASVQAALTLLKEPRIQTIWKNPHEA